MSKRTTEVIICDGCQAEIKTVYKIHEELDVTGGRFGVMVLGPRRDYCRACTIVRLRARADELEWEPITPEANR